MVEVKSNMKNKHENVFCVVCKKLMKIMKHKNIFGLAMKSNQNKTKLLM